MVRPRDDTEDHDMTDTLKPLDLLAFTLEGYLERGWIWAEEIASAFGDPIDVQRLRAAVVADSPELAHARAEADGLRTLLAAAADGDRPVFTPDEVARGTLVDLVEIVIEQRAEYREDAVRRRDELADVRSRAEKLGSELRRTLDVAQEVACDRIAELESAEEESAAALASARAELAQARERIAALEAEVRMYRESDSVESRSRRTLERFDEARDRIRDGAAKAAAELAERITAERDAAIARVAELEAALSPDWDLTVEAARADERARTEREIAAMLDKMAANAVKDDEFRGLDCAADYVRISDYPREDT